MDVAETAFWQAIAEWTPRVIAAAALFVITWFGKQTMLKKAAESAVLQAEKSKPGPGQGPKKKQLAVDALSKTMPGRVTMRAALADLVEDKWEAMDRKSKTPKPPLETPDGR